MVTSVRSVGREFQIVAAENKDSRVEFSLNFTEDIFRIIIGSDRRPKTEQGMEGKNVRFRSGRVRDRVRDKGSPI